MYLFFYANGDTHSPVIFCRFTFWLAVAPTHLQELQGMQIYPVKHFCLHLFAKACPTVQEFMYIRSWLFMHKYKASESHVLTVKASNWRPAIEDMLRLCRLNSFSFFLSAGLLWQIQTGCRKGWSSFYAKFSRLSQGVDFFLC